MVMLISTPDAPTPRMRENYLSEQVFERAGLGAAHGPGHRLLRERPQPGERGDRLAGVFMAPFGSDSTAIPLVAGDDVARVAAGVLTATNVRPGSSYPVIGQVLTVKEIVVTLAQVLGREVTYQDVSDEIWAEAALQSPQRPRDRAPLQTVGEPSHPADGAEGDLTTIRESWEAGSPKTFAEFVAEERSSFAGQNLALAG